MLTDPSGKVFHRQLKQIENGTLCDLLKSATKLIDNYTVVSFTRTSLLAIGMDISTKDGRAMNISLMCT